MAFFVPLNVSQLSADKYFWCGMFALQIRTQLYLLINFDWQKVQLQLVTFSVRVIKVPYIDYLFIYLN